ncbi:MAG: uspA [Firmicutes bacterium]|nr:uspA [Bacillota bacterium]
MKQLKKILVAYDGSPHSKQALEWAIDLSRKYGAEVCAVLVWGTFLDTASFALVEGGPAWASLTAKIKEAREKDLEMMDEVKLLGQAQKIKMNTVILEGDVATELIDYAKKEEMDMIIAGTRGHGTLDILLGSVTMKLVSLAPMPVMVVKD